MQKKIQIIFASKLVQTRERNSFNLIHWFQMGENKHLFLPNRVFFQMHHVCLSTIIQALSLIKFMPESQM